MKKMNFAICDVEENYACSLMEYMTEQKNVPFEILAFSSLESLKEFLKENTLDTLLISAQMMCQDIKNLEIRRIMILSEGELKEEISEYPAVYKYQPSEHLVAEVMNYYACQAIPKTWFLLKQNAQVIGVYSPVKRCGKTCFALTLGQILAETQRVLYINLEEYSGFSHLLEKEFSSDISDVMYFIRQNEGNILFKLNAVVQKLGKMDYIPPAFSAGDLGEVRPSEWLQLLEELLSAGGYETVILDLGDSVEDLFSLLSHCKAIYMPVLNDRISEAKLNQYVRQIREMNYEEVLDKTRQIELPFCEPDYGEECFWEHFAWSEMGKFVRALLKKEKE